MKLRRLLIAALMAVGLFMMSPMAFAIPSANILYQETDLGGGIWQYDYSFFNTSDAGEYLYKVFLDFGQALTATGSLLPSGWFGTVWEGTNDTSYLDATTIDSFYDIAPGSSISGFTFTVNSQLGNIQYTAEFDDHSGNLSALSGTTTAAVPEPSSSLLLISGGLGLLTISYLNRNKKA